MKYVAEDGTIFTCEKDCREYEDRYEDRTDPITNYVIMYNEELDNLNLTDNNISTNLKYCKYIHILSNVDRVKQFLVRNGSIDEGITHPGIYMLSVETPPEGYCYNSWVDLDDVIKEFRQWMDSYKAVKTGILQSQANRESGYNVN